MELWLEPTFLAFIGTLITTHSVLRSARPMDNSNARVNSVYARLLGPPDHEVDWEGFEREIWRALHDEGPVPCPHYYSEELSVQPVELPNGEIVRVCTICNERVGMWRNSPHHEIMTRNGIIVQPGEISPFAPGDLDTIIK